jgi:hypothetical protein
VARRPLERDLAVLRLDGETFLIVATFAADAKVRAERFDAVELESLDPRAALSALASR